jgi:hypothetical protein
VLILSKKRLSIQYNALKYCAITPRFVNLILSNFRVKGFRILIYIVTYLVTIAGVRIGN